jgi:hypothetical protein
VKLLQVLEALRFVSPEARTNSLHSFLVPSGPSFGAASVCCTSITLNTVAVSSVKDAINAKNITVLVMNRQPNFTIYKCIGINLDAFIGFHNIFY